MGETDFLPGSCLSGQAVSGLKHNIYNEGKRASMSNLIKSFPVNIGKTPTQRKDLMPVVKNHTALGDRKASVD